jgi:hypothetical protein
MMKLVLSIFSFFLSTFPLQVLADDSLPGPFSDGLCKYLAHDGDQENLNDACASLQEGIDRTILTHPNSVTCDHWIEKASDDDSRFHWMPLSNTTHLIRLRCNSGTYNESFIYFFVDQAKILLSKRGTKRKAPPIVLFPNDPVLLKKKEIRSKWNLKSHQAEVFEREFNAKTLKLEAFRKGLGDGSIGYYTHYEFNPKSGIPRLTYTAVRILEDHSSGYHFLPGKAPKGKGWHSFTPSSIVKGKVAPFL